MYIIGITGGIGSGKSEVLKYLNDHHQAYTVQLDEIAKQLYHKGQACHEQVVQTFGTGILDEHGEIVIHKLRELVFGNEPNRLRLNAFVHPAVKRWIIDDITKRREEGISLYVMEAALLIEEKYSEICDCLWYIYVDADERIRRLCKNRGLKEDKIRSIFQTQFSEDVYRKHCDYEVDNSGDFNDTKKQVDHIISDLFKILDETSIKTKDESVAGS